MIEISLITVVVELQRETKAQTKSLSPSKPASATPPPIGADLFEVPRFTDASDIVRLIVAGSLDYDLKTDSGQKTEG